VDALGLFPRRGAGLDDLAEHVALARDRVDTGVDAHTLAALGSLPT